MLEAIFTIGLAAPADCRPADSRSRGLSIDIRIGGAHAPVALIQAANLDTRQLRAEYFAAVDRACPGAHAAATDLWDRIATPQWTLEWQLPIWLGDRFGLDRKVARRVVLGNVLGLAAIRLADDLRDAEVAPADEQHSEILARALYEAAVGVYRRLLPGSARFWAQLELRMAEWRSAASDQESADSLASVAGLARRAAPLKISAFAVCELAGAAAAFGAVESCLDEALAAMVLYDHACDWEEDLAAGRRNAFVAACGVAQAGPGDSEKNHGRVLATMLATDVVAGYHARVRAGLERAAELAGRLDVAPLAAHLGALAREIALQGAVRQERYAELGRQAAQMIFGSGLDRSPGAFGE